MTAPHERRTEGEQREHAMTLARILMRPNEFVFGTNIADPPLCQMREARRRMVEARWDDAVPWLDSVITPIEKAVADREWVLKSVAAGRYADVRWIDSMAKTADVPLADAPVHMVYDENGNPYFVKVWRENEPSPWRHIARPAYEALLRRIRAHRHHSDPHPFPGEREMAARLWEVMTDEERAAVA